MGPSHGHLRRCRDYHQLLKCPGWRTKPGGQGPDPGTGEQANPVSSGHSTTTGTELCASRLSAHSPRDRGSGCRVEVRTRQVKKQGILQKLAKSSHYTETRRTRAACPEKEQSGRTHTARFQKILPCGHGHGSVALLWTDAWISGTGCRARDQPCFPDVGLVTHPRPSRGPSAPGPRSCTVSRTGRFVSRRRTSSCQGPGEGGRGRRRGPLLSGAVRTCWHQIWGWSTLGRQ